MAKRYWLFKSEPSSYSIDDLARDRRTGWDGVRNYQARNLLRDEIAVGDGVLFYHSSCEPMAVVGTATVVRAGHVDPTQFDRHDHHFDPDARPEEPRWFMVEIAFDRKLRQPMTLAAIKQVPGLAKMLLVKRGMRLSVQPVTAEEWKLVCKLGQ